MPTAKQTVFRHLHTVTITTRLKPDAVTILKRRAAKQGRPFNEYMSFLLEDQAFRDHDKERTERQRRKRQQQERSTT